jgi:hypothetical protein
MMTFAGDIETMLLEFSFMGYNGDQEPYSSATAKA